MIEFRSSPTIAELTKALCTARLAMGRLVNDQEAKVQTTKGEYNYKFADLAKVLEVAVGPLSDNGLAVLQATDLLDGGSYLLLTRLVHISGEWYESRWEAKATQATPQGEGSGLTYARRYQYLLVCGMAPADDDAASAERYVNRRLRDQQRQESRPARPPDSAGRGEINQQFMPAPGQTGDDGATAPTGGLSAYLESTLKNWEIWYQDQCRKLAVVPLPEGLHATLLDHPDMLLVGLTKTAIADGVIAESDCLNPPKDGKPAVRGRARCLQALEALYRVDRPRIDRMAQAFLQEKADEHLRALGANPDAEVVVAGNAAGAV